MEEKTKLRKCLEDKKMKPIQDILDENTINLLFVIVAILSMFVGFLIGNSGGS